MSMEIKYLQIYIHRWYNDIAISNAICEVYKNRPTWPSLDLSKFYDLKAVFKMHKLEQILNAYRKQKLINNKDWSAIAYFGKPGQHV